MTATAQLRIVTTEGRAFVTRVQSMPDAFALHDVLGTMMREPENCGPITLRTFWNDAPFTLAPSAIGSVEVIPLRPGMWTGDLWTP